MSIQYIDLSFLLDNIGRDKIREFTMNRIGKKIYLYITHYHNLENVDKYLISTNMIFIIEHTLPIVISSLYGLTKLTRLKISDMRHLYELPYFGDSVQLEKLLIYSNGLIQIPRCLPKTMIYIDCSHNQLKEAPVLNKGLKHFYCDHNQLYTLNNIPASITTITINDNILNEYVGGQYSRFFRKNLTKLNQFRWNYYFLKYGRRFLYYFLENECQNKNNVY